MELQELKDHLEGMGQEGTVVLEQPDYAGAVVGITDTGRLAYDFEKMVGWLMERDGMEYDEAVEFIEYNTIRALPYMGEKAPVVIYPLE